MARLRAALLGMSEMPAEPPAHASKAKVARAASKKRKTREARFKRRAYAREYMRKWRAKREGIVPEEGAQ